MAVEGLRSGSSMRDGEIILATRRVRQGMLGYVAPRPRVAQRIPCRPQIRAAPSTDGREGGVRSTAAGLAKAPVGSGASLETAVPPRRPGRAIALLHRMGQGVATPCERRARRVPPRSLRAQKPAARSAAGYGFEPQARRRCLERAATGDPCDAQWT